MSFLPPDLLPGDPAVGGMLISAGPTQPFFAPASGGGGGGGGPNLVCSTLTVADSASISSIFVSSINGASPGGGGSAFTSSFLLTIPGGTSSLVMALPAGQYAFMGTALYTGSNNFLSGTASALQNVTSLQWSANVIENPNTGNRPADSGSGCSMILNTWENPLSTAKLYINNVNASPAGDATWAGVVGKLY